MLISPTLWKKKLVPLSTIAHSSVIQFFPITCSMFKGLGTWEQFFFTPLWQIECTSMATTAIKENDNFLYPQKKVMSLSRCAGPPSQCGNIFKQRHRSYLQPPPSTIEHSLHKCLGKAFPNHRGVCHSAWKWNASQLQTTPELISKSICYDEYYFCTKTAILYTPFRFRIQFFVLKGNKSIPKSSTWLPMNFLRSLFFWRRASQSSRFAENDTEA